ncbi:MAG: ATP-binding cassette domain-containing protein [Polyangiales bacterium]
MSFAHSELVPLVVDASFHLDRGFTGLVGANGAGKTTLLRLLAGELAPDEGVIQRPESVVLCPQRVDVPDAHVVDLLARNDREAHRLAAGLDRKPWHELSPGMRKRWQIAGALAREPEVLLLDEPTNHLDEDGRAHLLRALGSFSGTCVIVSHDRELLAALTTSVLRIDKGRVQHYALGFDEARAAWDEEANAERRRYDEAKEAERSRKRALHALRVEHEKSQRQRSAKARMRDENDNDGRGSLAKGKALMAEARLGRSVAAARAKLENAAEELPDKPLPALGRSLFVGFEPSRQAILATLEDGRVIRRDDRIHVAGANGAGKTTLLRTIQIARALVLPQELEIEETLRLLDHARALSRDARGRVMSLVAALGVDPSKLLASAKPSPGEARKLALAIGLGAHAPALILDEPTNHLDLPSIERLEEALVRYPGALVLVTHDERLARKTTSTRWEVLHGDRSAMRPAPPRETTEKRRPSHAMKR